MDINKEMVADRVYEKLIKSTPKHPAIGWVSLDTYYMFDRTGVPHTFDFREILRELTDARFEYRYDEARLLRSEPYALEVRNSASLKSLTALYILHQKGVAEATPEQIAEESRCAVSTVKSFLRLGEYTGFYVRTKNGTYYLTFDGDRTLWECKSWRLTTLSEEANLLPLHRLEEIQKGIRIHTERVKNSFESLKILVAQLEEFSEETQARLIVLPRKK